MAVFTLKDGQQVLWEPTTDLVCTCCRKPIDIFTLRQGGRESANFMFDFDHPSGNPLAAGEYFYLHKRCSQVEKALRYQGVTVNWGWHPMLWVLGIDTVFNNNLGNLSKYLRKQMPPGVYNRLYAQWRPAIKPQKNLRVLSNTQREDLQAVTKGAKQLGWLALRYQIMKRDNYRCRICGVSRDDGDHVRLEIDHITPRVKGGTDDSSNLWVLCFFCNRGKGTQDL